MSIIYFIMLIRELSYIGLFVPIILIISSIIQRKLNNNILKPLYVKKAIIGEEMSNKISNMVQNAKSTKLNAWEEIIYDKLEKLKLKDKALIAKSFLLQGVVSSILQAVPAITSIVCLSLYQRCHDFSFRFSKKKFSLFYF